MKVSREDFAWAAGLFEGEGSISGRGRKHNPKDRGMTLKVKMTDEDIVNKFYNAIGRLGNMKGPYHQPKKKPVWIWQTAKFEHVQAVVAYIWPWLCSRRKEKFRQILFEYYRLKPNTMQIIRNPVTGRIERSIPSGSC